MKRAILVTLAVVLVALLVYVGLFARLVWAGRAHARVRGLTNAYVLADPDAPGGVARHDRRSRVFAPLIGLTALGDLHTFPAGFLVPLPPHPTGGD